MDVDPNIISEIVVLSKEEPKFEERCQFLANCIKTNVRSIMQLIEDLGPFLTNTTIDDREKGTLILSLVLTHLPNDILTSTQLNYICTFYSDRLNDHHQVVPAVIKGLTPLVSSRNIPDGLSTQLLTSLFQHVPCQQQQQHDRYNIYQFIKTILDKRKEEMKAMGLDLVYGVISAIDSERDPRNLMFLFRWLPDFLKSIELGQLTEEMFDVISCYFPVDFRPSDQEENVITRGNLADALCPCLCALPSFGEFCIPLALEKLETELYIAKLDSLNLLIEGCSNFPLDTYKQHGTTIWSLIQKEIFTSKVKDDKELEKRCLLALTSILRKLSQDIEFAKQITKDIIDTLKGNLSPDTALFIPSTMLIRSISQASSHTAELVFKETCPLLINLYNITSTPTYKAAILKQLVDFAITYMSLNSKVSTDDTENLKLVPNICLRAIVDTDIQIRRAGIYNFAALAQYTSSATRSYFYENLSMLITLTEEPEVREAIIVSLKVYAGLYYQEIQSMLEKIQINNGLKSLQLYLEAIASVVCIPELMPFALSILVENILKPLDTSIIAVKILGNVLEEDDIAVSKYLYEDQIVEKLIDYCLGNSNSLNVDLHSTYLNSIAKILIIVLRYVEVNVQESLIRSQLEKIQCTSEFNNLNLIIKFGLLTSLKPNVKISINIIEILDTTIGTKSPDICTIGCQLLANIINKTTDENTLIGYLNDIEIKCNLSADKQTENIIEVIIFTTKALVVRSHPHMSTWAVKLINLSANYLKAAKGFQVIFDDNYECLSHKSYCKRGLLYKQKFFAEVCNYIVSNYEDGKKHYLIILGYLLQNIPQQILRLELKKIIRLMLLCLSYCEEFEVLLAVSMAINTLIEDKDELAEDYIQEFLKYYLKLASFDRSMQIRILALKGIQSYSTYPLYKLLPLKQNVLAILSNCLDDKKRLVRKEAVEARSKWIMIDAPI